MTTVGRGMLLSLVAPLLAALSMATAASEPVAAGLARCAAVAQSAPRLACYDALVGQAATEKPQVVEQAAVAAAPAAPALPAAPKPPAPQSPPVSGPADSTQNFGLSATQLHTAPQGPAAIQAHIAEVREDQLRRSSVVLDNGQVWASTEGEMLLSAGEAVTISRAALGSFMLTSASKHAYHVRRVR